MKKKSLTDKQKKMIIVGGVALLVVLFAIICVTFLFKDVKDDKVEEQEPVKIDIPEGIKILNPSSTTRPIAIMINNAPAARPYHRGLQDAYIVYEIVVEGGITRMMALFKDIDMDEDLIGSVRSSRHYYLDYVMENDAIYVHHGKSPQASSDMSKYGINHIDAEGVAFTRDRSLGVSSEHTSYANLKGIEEVVKKKGFRTTLDGKKGLLLKYKVEALDLSTMEGAIKSDNISITYSNVNTTSYTYDSENKVYLRNINGKAHTDYDTKKQYTAKNIITYQVENNTIPDGGKGRQDLSNVGSGTGYYISNGYAVPIKWSKESRESKTKYTYNNGEEIEVNDGNTFIQIQPKGQNITIE